MGDFVLVKSSSGQKTAGTSKECVVSCSYPDDIEIYKNDKDTLLNPIWHWGGEGLQDPDRLNKIITAYLELKSA